MTTSIPHPRGDKDDALATVAYPEMSDADDRGAGGSTRLTAVAQLARRRAAAACDGLRVMRDGLVRRAGGVQGPLVAALLAAAVAVLGVSLRAPPVAALIAAPGDPVTDRVARAEASLTETLRIQRALSEDLAELRRTVENAKTTVARQATALDALEAAQAAQGEMLRGVRDEARATAEALGRLTASAQRDAADRAEADAQIAAQIARITTIAEQLATALGTGPVADPRPRPAAQPTGTAKPR